MINETPLPATTEEKFNESGDLVILSELKDTDLQQKMWNFYVQTVRT